jgi:hypothetical protein
MHFIFSQSVSQRPILILSLWIWSRSLQSLLTKFSNPNMFHSFLCSWSMPHRIYQWFYHCSIRCRVQVTKLPLEQPTSFITSPEWNTEYHQALWYSCLQMLCVARREVYTFVNYIYIFVSFTGHPVPNKLHDSMLKKSRAYWNKWQVCQICDHSFPISIACF